MSTDSLESSLVRGLSGAVTMTTKVVAASIFIAGFVNVANAQTGEASAALRARVEAYQTVWNTHDPSALAAFFTEDADMIMGNLPIMRGRQAIQEWWQDYFANQEPERRGTFVVTSLRFITADVGMVNLATTTGGRNAQGQELLTRKARGTVVWVRQAGEWFISAMRGMPTERDRIIRASDQDQLKANKALARRWFEEVINQRNLDAIADIYAANYVYHGAGGTEFRGIKAIREFAASILAASDDRRAVVEQQVVEGNLVVTRFTSSGKHTGVWQGIEPTGKIWTTEGIVISRIENGKIAEDWEIIHVSGF